MGANSFGSRFVVTTFGESHGPALGVVIDGCPAGVKWDQRLLERELERRRPGQSAVVSARNETDQPELLSGVFEGKTLGTPITIMVRNTDQRPADYEKIARKARIGHADDVWRLKFGHSDHRGGGRSSGRETAARVMAGAVAQMLNRQLAPRLRVRAFASQIGPFELSATDLVAFDKSRGPSPADRFSARFPSRSKVKEVERLLIEAKAEGHSYGGMVELWIDGAPTGLGEPVFHKLKSEFAAAFLSVGATVGFELGEGFAAARAEGSEFHRRSGGERYGGIRGGLATGERIVVRVAFKPTSTVLETAKRGRHDPCIVPRAVPVLEAMAHLVLVDQLLWQRANRL